jgi:hypothetical protein
MLLLAALLAALLPATGGSAAEDAPQVLRFHGGGYDRAAAMTVDGAGDAYVGGAVDVDGEATFAVVKVGPSGTVWSATYDGSRGGVGGSAHAVAVDDASNVYAAGAVGDGSFYPRFDYLVVAFDPDGRQRWAARFDGPGADDNTDRATGIAVDADGVVYVTGVSYTPSPNFTFDWSTQKYGATGELLWERRERGVGDHTSRVADIALAPDGTLVVTGTAFNADSEYASDVGTVAYDPDGNVVWRRTWSNSATSDDEPSEMAIDGAGRIAVTGTSGLFPPLPFILRYDSTGTLLQAIRGDGGASVDVDGAGNLTVAGRYGDSFVSRYDASGVRTWATPPSEDGFWNLFVRTAPDGSVTAAGTSGQDYLVIKFAQGGEELWRYRFNGRDGGDDRVAGLAIDSSGTGIVTGTSWNDYLSNRGGTADDIVTLRFPAAAAAPALVAPTDLTATGISRSQIRLGWTDDGGTEDGFHIERCAGNGCSDFTRVATVGFDVTTFTDSGLARNTRYAYRVRAFNAKNVSAYSNIAVGKTRRR